MHSPAPRLALLFSLVVAATASAACRQVLGIDDRKVGSSGEGGQGGAGGEGQGAGPGTGGTGGASGTCSLDLLPKKPLPGCQACLLQQCCAELSVCESDPGCAGCVAVTEACDEFSVDVNAELTALTDCAHEACGDICYPPAGATEPTCDDEKLPQKACVSISSAVQCVPYFQQSLLCPSWNKETCDVPQDNFNAANGLVCAPAPNPNHICEPCGVIEGYCHSGLTCVNGKCGRWCCGDDDCPGGHCDTAWTALKFGGNPPPEIEGLGVCAKSP